MITVFAFSLAALYYSAIPMALAEHVFSAVGTLSWDLVQIFRVMYLISWGVMIGAAAWFVLRKKWKPLILCLMLGLVSCLFGGAGKQEVISMFVLTAGFMFEARLPEDTYCRPVVMAATAILYITVMYGVGTYLTSLSCVLAVWWAYMRDSRLKVKIG